MWSILRLALVAEMRCHRVKGGESGPLSFLSCNGTTKSLKASGKIYVNMSKLIKKSHQMGGIDYFTIPQKVLIVKDGVVTCLLYRGHKNLVSHPERV